MKFSSSVFGANFGSARSFQLSFNAAGGASVNSPLVQGGYSLVSSQDCLVTYGPTSGPPAAAALPATQPAANLPNATVRVPAGVPFPLDIPLDLQSIAVLGATASAGVIAIIGPVGFTEMT